jgi:twitching motility two-component system response regulator PilH
MSIKKKILIVEDEPDLVETLGVFFRENGYETIAAYDGHDGFIKAEKDEPDLITLDISMPGESGVKMYRNLINSGKTKNIPVIIITAAPSELKGFIKRMKSFPDPAGYFEKPVDREELLTKVKDLIGA